MSKSLASMMIQKGNAFFGSVYVARKLGIISPLTLKTQLGPEVTQINDTPRPEIVDASIIRKLVPYRLKRVN